MKRTKPPFRADHVGSLLRPARAEGGARASAPRARSRRRAEGGRRPRDRARHQEAGGGRACKPITDGEFRRSWWHLDFLWGLDGAEKLRHGQRHRSSRGVQTRNEGVAVTGKLGIVRAHPMVEHFKFVAGAYEAHAEDHHSGAVGDLRPRRSRRRSARRPIRDMERFFDDLGQAYQQGGARLRRRRLPLSAARRGVHRHAVRSEVSRADARPRRRSGEARPRSTPT